MLFTGDIAKGFCHCGCGQKAGVARRSDARYGVIKGEHARYVRGHQGAKQRCDTTQIGGFKLNNVYCKLVPLTLGLYAVVCEADFELVMQWRWYAQRTPDGRKHYAVRAEKGTNGRTIKVRMHRVILGLAHNDPRIGDHIRPDETLNNTRANLRVANRTESQCNRFMPKHNTSGFKGVTWNTIRRKYQASICVNGKHYNLGCYTTPEEASLRYEDAVRKYHGEFAQPK